MKFSLALLFTSLFTPILAQSGCPNGVRQRPNYLTMSQADKDKFHNAIKRLNTAQGGNQYANFTSIHYRVGSGAHGSPGFFVWHRKYVREFEKALQKIDSSIMVPYWDWTRDSQAPERSRIFANNNMGGNGGSGSGGCIQSGTFSGWRVQSANSGCVRRYFARGTTIPSWTAPEILDNYLNQRTRYDDIRQQVESTGHALVHTGIGGNNGDMSFMYSPNDPIFWLHHGFIDYIWWEWQQRHSSAANDYPTNPDTTRLAIYGDPVSSTFNTRSSEYCYTYPRWTVNAPKVDASTPPSGGLQAAGSPDSATEVNGAQSKGTSASNAPSSTASAPKSRRALDVARLAPQVSNFPGFVGPNDRTASNKIRVPDQVPTSYLQMNNISPAVALENYLQSAIIACKLNLLPNFTPLANLEN
jgi:hypothetical protein